MTIRGPSRGTWYIYSSDGVLHLLQKVGFPKVFRRGTEHDKKLKTIRVPPKSYPGTMPQYKQSLYSRSEFGDSAEEYRFEMFTKIIYQSRLASTVGI